MTSSGTLKEHGGWPAGDGEMFRLVRDYDWAASPLGDVVTWPRSFRLAVELVLESPIAMILMWGPDLVQIYNDGYRALIGAKHPSGLGRPTHDCWPEVRSFTEPVYAAVLDHTPRKFSSVIRRRCLNAAAAAGTN